MKAVLYLERINQEMINKEHTNRIIKEIDKQLVEQRADSPDWGGNVWDKSCCIINLRKREPDIYELEDIGQFITMRREKFGGLVWVRKTNAVYQIDEEAFMVLNDLDNGVPIRQAAKAANVTEEEVKSLIAQLKTPISPEATEV